MDTVEFFSYAKWILSGEHTVVRGGKAIGFPLRRYKNVLTFQKSDAVSVISNLKNTRNIIISLLETASRLANISPKKICGKFTINSDIATKVGLGSSAAICANIASVFKYYGLYNNAINLATHLENKFHKKSSGLDVAIAIKNQPIIFQRNNIKEILYPSFWPHLILTYSGEKSATSSCAEIVKQAFLKNETVAYELDSLMNQASDSCEYAFKNANFEKLKDGINIGSEVFTRWGLCNDSVKEHMEKLLFDGAVAAKPIGSGLGGYIVSLWEEKPKKYQDICLTLEKP